MKRIILGLIGSLLAASLAVAAPLTTKPNVSNTLAQCLLNVPLVGAAAGSPPVCDARGALGTAAFGTIGTSGATIGLLNTANTWSGVQSFAANQLLLAGVTGSTQCLQVNSSGVVTGSGGTCGGTGAPGGSNTQLQYNNAGGFGGITGATTNGTTLTLVAPVLGTPASVTLTNATGLPIGTGVSGLGTGVGTALSVNVGSAGAPVLFNGAGGTPSSLALANAAGLPANTGLINQVPVANGGTGVTTGVAEQARLLISSFLTAPVSINFNVAGDTAVPVQFPTGFTQFRPGGLIIDQCSASISTATFGVFTATGGGGAVIVAAGAAGTVTNNTPNTANNMQFNSAVSPNTIATTPTAGNIFFRVGATAAATCQFYMIFNPLP